MAAPVKASYTIPCASAFRDAVEALARRKGVNVGDIARSVMLVVPPLEIDGHPDPGGPAEDDRETVVLKSGPQAGRPWRRKPRLQVRMVPGLPIPYIRKALDIALRVERGDRTVELVDPRVRRPAPEAAAPPPPPPPPEPEPVPEPEPAPPPPAPDPALLEEVERLQAVVSVLSFEPLPEGVTTRPEALYVLGFPPGARPDKHTLRARFRILATIHHPDGRYGSHERMAQINAAMELLR